MTSALGRELVDIRAGRAANRLVERALVERAPVERVPAVRAPAGRPLQPVGGRVRAERRGLALRMPE